MLRWWKRYRLKQTITRVEGHALAKNAWGNNIPTLVVFNKILSDHISLFDQGYFIAHKRNLTLQSSFSNIEEMNNWLVGIKGILREAAEGLITQLPEERSNLNITKQSDIDVYSFISKGNYPHNLNKVFESISKHIAEISEHYNCLTANQQKYFNLRFQNGLNTCLVFHEQLLEVMIND